MEGNRNYLRPDGVMPIVAVQYLQSLYTEWAATRMRDVHLTTPTANRYKVWGQSL